MFLQKNKINSDIFSYDSSIYFEKAINDPMENMRRREECEDREREEHQ
jgi:hypothetical protein